MVTSTSSASSPMASPATNRLDRPLMAAAMNGVNDRKIPGPSISSWPRGSRRWVRNAISGPVASLHGGQEFGAEVVAQLPCLLRR